MKPVKRPARPAHPDAVLIAAADRVAGAIARKLAGEPVAEVVPLPGAGARPMV